MTFTRRTMLALFAAAALPAFAEAPWPDKLITLVLPFSAGGPGDITTRLIAQALGKQLGQTVIVVNKPGAGGIIGSDYVAKSAPNGYTLLIAGNGAVSNALLRPKMPYADDDLVPVVFTNSAPSVIVVDAAGPIQTLKDLQAYGKRKGGLSFGTAGAGSTGHFVAEMVRSALGVPVTVVHYKSGSETVAAILGGQIDLASEAPVGVLGHVRGGKLRGIAVCDDKRVPVLADIPTTVEQGFATIQMQHWGGVFAPKGTPVAILDRIAQAMQKAFATDAGLRAQMEANGLRTTVGSRADFVAFLSNEKARLGEIVNATGMTLE